MLHPQSANTSKTSIHSSETSLNSSEPDLLQLPLSQALRFSTAQAHEDAESSKFVGLVFQGQATPTQYYWYLESLLQVYTTLEAQLEQHHNHPAVAPIYLPLLFRVQALQHDLAHWSFAKSELPKSISTAVAEYVLRIEGVSNKSPELLVAHAYVRYLGDLSGGQALAQAMTKAGVAQEGLNFYNFGNINKVQVKNQYRAQLDLIGTEFAPFKEALCNEANLVFKLNSQVFKAFDLVESAP